jgi:hypothetical protein
MVIDILKICCLLFSLILPLFLPIKKKTRKIKFPKNYNNTSEAQYAINDRGFLEKIHKDNLSSQAN